MPKLMLKFEAAFIREIKLDKPSFTIGRKPDNDIALDNAAVSGHHCKMYESGGTWYVEDLNSTNGTFVNGKKTLKAGLKNGDTINLVKFSLVYADEAAAPAAAEQPLPPQRQKTPLGALEVLENPADARKDFELTGLSTYIGKSDRVQVQIKGSGLFGSAPEVAASVHRKPEGYVLMAVEAGYPVVNGTAVSGYVILKDGDLIDCGGTTMQFIVKDVAN